MYVSLRKERDVEIILWEHVDEEFCEKHGLNSYVPILEKQSGELMQESHDIVEYLESLDDNLPILPGIFSGGTILDIQRKLFPDLRFATQYYYKMHYLPSFFYPTEVKEISDFPGTEIEATSMHVAKIEEIITERFQGKNQLDGLNSDDFDIYPDLRLTYLIQEVMPYKFGPMTLLYIREIHRLCKHVKYFDLPKLEKYGNHNFFRDKDKE